MPCTVNELCRQLRCCQTLYMVILSCLTLADLRPVKFRGRCSCETRSSRDAMTAHSIKFLLYTNSILLRQAAVVAFQAHFRSGVRGKAPRCRDIPALFSRTTDWNLPSQNSTTGAVLKKPENVSKAVFTCFYFLFFLPARFARKHGKMPWKGKSRRRRATIACAVSNFCWIHGDTWSPDYFVLFQHNVKNPTSSSDSLGPVRLYTQIPVWYFKLSFARTNSSACPNCRRAHSNDNGP